MKARHRSIPDRASIERTFRASANGRTITVRLFAGWQSHGYQTDGEAIEHRWLEFLVEQAGKRPQRHACRYTGRNLPRAEADFLSNLRDAHRVGVVEVEA